MANDLHTWTQREEARSIAEFRSTPLETCWRVGCLTGTVITCEIHQTAGGFQVRARYALEVLVESQLSPTLEDARRIADAWRRSLLANEYQDLALIEREKRSDE